MKVEYNYTRQQSYAVYNFLVKIQKETSELVNGSFFVFFCFLGLFILGKIPRIGTNGEIYCQKMQPNFDCPTKEYFRLILPTSLTTIHNTAITFLSGLAPWQTYAPPSYFFVFLILSWLPSMTFLLIGS